MTEGKNQYLVIALAVVVLAAAAYAYSRTGENQPNPTNNNTNTMNEADLDALTEGEEGGQRDAESTQPEEDSASGAQEPVLAPDAASGQVEGLQVETLKAGTGTRQVASGDTVSVHYVGTLTNGTKFDSSVDRGTPFATQIGVGRVIEGWDLGIVGMKVGEKRKLTIAPELGYGSQAVGSIPANSTLVFEVELLAIK